MSKQTNFEGMSFRIAFIAENGELLLHSEWSTNRDAVAHLTDSINHARNQKHLRITATIETKGTGYVDLNSNRYP